MDEMDKSLTLAQLGFASSVSIVILPGQCHHSRKNLYRTMKYVTVLGILLVCVFSGMFFWPQKDNSDVELYDGKLSRSKLTIVSYISEYVTSLYITSGGNIGVVYVVVNVISMIFVTRFLYTILKVVIG